MIKTNQDRIPKISVIGEISSPKVRSAYTVGHDGVPRVSAGMGGIAYNVRIGDRAFGWVGDHVEPGVSLRNSDEASNGGLNLFSCVGNRAFVVSGEAKGSEGVVTGKHGGIEHVLVDFQPEVLERLAIGDKVQVRSWGQGLQIDGFPGVRVMNLDPDLLDRMGIIVNGEKLSVSVVAIVSAELMGSGIGSAAAERGDYDITTQDPEVLRAHRLTGLRLGDIVLIRDRASFFGRQYRQGGIEIGVVVHSNSDISGHGPGVTTLLTCLGGEIEPVIDPTANLSRYLGVREV